MIDVVEYLLLVAIFLISIFFVVILMFMVPLSYFNQSVDEESEPHGGLDELDTEAPKW